MKLLIVYRHGERSDEAPEHRKVEFECVSDAPLTAVGHEQAEIAANTIQELLDTGCSIHLVSSPMIRCLQTATKLARRLGVSIYIEEGFGECYCQHHFPIHPFENLHMKLKPEMFEESLAGVQLVENDHAFRPNNPESMEQLHERMDKMLNEYIIGREEDIVIVCSHFMPLKKITELIGGSSDIESQHTLITVAKFTDGNFQVLKNGCFQHLPQRLVKPIP